MTGTETEIETGAETEMETETEIERERETETETVDVANFRYKIGQAVEARRWRDVALVLIVWPCAYI